MLFTTEQEQVRKELKTLGVRLDHEDNARCAQEAAGPSKDYTLGGAPTGSSRPHHLAIIAQRIYYHEQQARQYKALLKSLPELMDENAARALVDALSSKF